MGIYEQSVNEFLNDKDTLKNINAAVKDLVSSLLYYDRKEDEDLPMDKIQEALNEGLISESEIIKIFSNELKDALK